MAVPEVDEVERAPDGSSAKQAAMGAATSSVAPSALQLDRLVVASRSTPSDQLEPLLTVTHPPGQPEPLIQSSKLPVRWQADPASPATRSSALLSIPRSLGQLVEVQLNLSSRDSADIYLAYATNDAELERLTTYPSAVNTSRTAVRAQASSPRPSGYRLQLSLPLPTSLPAGKLLFALVDPKRGLLLASFALWLDDATPSSSSPDTRSPSMLLNHSLPPTPETASRTLSPPVRPNGVARALTSPNLHASAQLESQRTLPAPTLDLPDLSLDSDDGPLFRATLNDLEKRANALRKSAKTLSKAAETSLLTLTAHHEAANSVDEALAETLALATLSEVYLREARARARTSRRDSIAAWEEGVCAPLRRLLNVLKCGEAKKKLFEAASKGYYDDLAKYLGKPEKEDVDDTKRSDEKQAMRKHRFDLARFEWHACLLDLAIFREVELLTLLTHYARVQHTIDAHRTAEIASLAPALDTFTESRAEDLAKHVESQCAAIETRRKELESRYAQSAAAAGELAILDPKPDLEPLDRLGKLRAAARSRSANLLAHTAMTPSASAPVLSTTATKAKAPNKSPYQGYRDLEPVDPEPSTERKKEGFLWATSRPNAPQSGGEGGSRAQWHKYWVVLCGGQLIEYSGWRDGLEVHNTPINLRFATVREARLQDRRFTFEVVTRDTRRIYQATSEVEAKQWQRAVANSIESLLNGTSTVRAFDTSHLQHGDKDEYGAPHMPKPSSFAPPLSPSLSGGPGAALDRLAGWAAKPLQRRSSAGGEAARQHRKRDSASQKIQAGLVSMGIGRDRRSSQTGEAAAKRASLAVMPIPDSSKSASALSLPVSAETNGLGLGFAPTDWHRGRTKSNGSSSRASASSGDDFDRRIAETVHSMTMSPAVGADEKARNQVELMELLSRPENRSCADCGRADPRWASWSLGTFICLRCSGVHRSLGTHISKVRSVDLDQWSAEQVAPLREIGNARAHELYGPPAPPDADMTLHIKQRYTEHSAALALAARSPSTGIAL